MTAAPKPHPPCIVRHATPATRGGCRQRPLRRAVPAGGPAGVAGRARSGARPPGDRVAEEIMSRLAASGFLALLAVAVAVATGLAAAPTQVATVGEATPPLPQADRRFAE